MRVHLLLYIAGLLSATLPAFAQLAPDDHEAGPYVMVFAEPQLRGDVRFLLAPSQFPEPPDLVQILQRSLGCDWRPTLVTPKVAQGTCRHLLHTDGGMVRDTLNLAPLGAALHHMGTRQINFSLAAQGRSLGSEDSNWIRGSVGRTADTGKMADITNWSFSSWDDDELPAPFAVEIGNGWSLRRMIMPLAIVLIGPFLLAVSVRRHMLRTGAPAGAGGVWLSWILLGAWLYWITVIGLENLIGFANALDTDYWPVALILGTVLFCGPPLASVALCATVLAPAINRGESAPGQAWRTLRVLLAGEARFMAPLGFFLMGTAMVPQEFKAGLTSILLMYGTYRILGYYVWRWTFRHTTQLTSGPLYDRAVEIAGAAGVKLASLAVVENRSPMEANAYASPGGRIAIARSLVEKLTCREVDTVLGHEIGHSRGNNSWWRLPFLMFYMFVGGPAIVRFTAQAGFPAWVIDLPILPLVYVMVAGWISQKQELVADSRAAKVTNDPEAAIAALANLSRMTKLPVNWTGMQGSILSHPSMQKRVLALAKQSGIVESRALELLHNPEALLPEGAERVHYGLPEFLEANQPVYNSIVRYSHLYWGTWVFGGSLIGLLVLVYAAALGVAAPLRVAWLTAAMPFVAAAALSIDEQYSNGFMDVMRRRIEARRKPRPGGTFVALLPGETVRAVEGVYAWDLGHLYLEDGRMTFEGERVQFGVDASDVQSVGVASGRPAWFRNHAALIRTTTATFSLRTADHGASQRLAKQLMQRILAWKANAAAPETAGDETRQAPKLPQVREANAAPGRVLWYFVKTAALIAIGASLVTMIAVGYAFSTKLVPAAAATLYLVAVAPGMLRFTTYAKLRSTAKLEQETAAN